MIDPSSDELSDLRDLDARLRALQQVEPSSPDDFRRAAQAYVDLERACRIESRRRRDATCGDESPLAGDPVAAGAIVGSIEAWRASCRREGHAAATERCDDALRRWRTGLADAWRAQTLASAPDASSEGLHELILETMRLELATYREEPDASASLRLSRTKRELRGELERRLAATPPHRRTVAAWRRAMIDRVDAALADSEDADLSLAIRRLDAVDDDATWHLERLERPGDGDSWFLRRRLKRLRAEREERAVQRGLERVFGRMFVAWWERLIFVLLFVLTGLLLVEAFAELSPAARRGFEIADLCVCSAFLLDFFVKWGFARWSGSWFRRHWLLDLLPAIPLGFGLSFLEQAEAANWLQLGRWLRMLRISASIRYLRLLLPGLRGLRAAVFFARGLDRVARRYAKLMNHDVILYPTREEMEVAHRVQPRAALAERFLEREIRQLWRRLVEDAPPESKGELALIRAAALGSSLDDVLVRIDMSGIRSATSRRRDVTAGRLLEHLASVAPEELDALLEPETVSRIARFARYAAYLPTSWLGWARFVPAGTALSDSEIAAAACRRSASILSRLHDAAYWTADLHGTVSPSLFVDRVGSVLVKNSFRPATRLILFGGVYLVVEGILHVVPLEALRPVEDFLTKYVGTTLLVLGGVCAVVLALGWWLQQVAREATEFYDRFAQAQFLSLTETIRERLRRRDLELLYDRVLRPEWALAGAEVSGDRERRLDSLDRSLGSATGVEHDPAEAIALARTERATLLYRDWIDGAMFLTSDCRATVQLLGNPCLLQFYAMSRRIPRSATRRLEKLDLERPRVAIDGPCQWMRRIAQSISHSVAALLVEYNRRAVPLDELSLLDESARERHRRWLVREEEDSPAPDPTGFGKERYVTNAFHALHFLDQDDLRDREIAARFGEETLRRLRADRVHLIRTIFGAGPLHERPREERVFNAYLAYRRHVARGRWLLAPLTIAAWASRRCLGAIAWTARTVWEMRRPERRRRVRVEIEPDFLAAMRKIDRVRRPIAVAAMKLRSFVDPEYLGAALPYQRESGLAKAGIDEDVEFLRADPLFEEEARDQRLRAAADMARVEKLLDGGLAQRLAERLGAPAETFRSPEMVRAIAIAYFADLDGVRLHLSPLEILHEATERTQLLHAFGAIRWRNVALAGPFREWIRRRGQNDRESRRVAWRAIVHDVWDAGECLRTWNRLGESAPAEGERRLAELLRHPGRIDEYVLSLRTIQTLTLLDVAYYRRQVYRLGAYSESGVDFGKRLRWMGRDWGDE